MIRLKPHHRRQLGTFLLVPVVAGCALALAPQSAHGQTTDRVIYHSGYETEGAGWGQIREMRVDRVVYVDPNDDARTQRLNPWQIQWIQFGDEGLPQEWVTGMFELRSGSYDQAVGNLERFFNYNFREEIRSEQRRIMVTWSTHYYLGRAYMGVGEEIERQAERLLSEMQDSQTDQSVLYRDLRSSVERGMSQMQRSAGSWLDESFNEARGELVDMIRDHSDKSFFVSDEFTAKLREVALAAAKGVYSRAVEVLNHMFVSPPDANVMAFNETESLWFFEMKLAKAQSLRGAGRYAEAVAELDSSLVSRIAGESVPRRGAAELTNNPYMIERATNLAGREPGYFHYVNRGYNILAEICVAAGEIPGALTAYERLRRQFRPHPQFSQYYNEAALNYAFTLSYQHGFNRARSELQSLIDNVGFESFSNDRFEPGYVLTEEQNRIVAGAYVAIGDLALREYEERGNTQRRQEALEAYLRVTAFGSDDNLRAKALYYASRIYRDIANEWESDWARRPAEDADGRVINPYFYYLQMSDRLRTELEEMYPQSEWGQLLR